MLNYFVPDPEGANLLGKHGDNLEQVSNEDHVRGLDNGGLPVGVDGNDVSGLGDPGQMLNEA